VRVGDWIVGAVDSEANRRAFQEKPLRVLGQRLSSRTDDTRALTDQPVRHGEIGDGRYFLLPAGISPDTVGSHARARLGCRRIAVTQTKDSRSSRHAGNKGSVTRSVPDWIAAIAALSITCLIPCHRAEHELEQPWSVAPSRRARAVLLAAVLDRPRSAIAIPPRHIVPLI
jgi:hypothetical protein